MAVLGSTWAAEGETCLKLTSLIENIGGYALASTFELEAIGEGLEIILPA